MIVGSHTDCTMFKNSLAFTFQFSMQLATIPKHSWTSRVQPAISGTDNIHKLQLPGFILLIPSSKGHMWVLVTPGKKCDFCVLSENFIGHLMYM